MDPRNTCGDDTKNVEYYASSLRTASFHPDYFALRTGFGIDDFSQHIL